LVYVLKQSLIIRVLPVENLRVKKDKQSILKRKQEKIENNYINL
jgi:hypothetical protein